MATSVTQYGTTLEFDTDYTVGQYANGDYYIVENTPGGGVTITGKTPASTKISGRTKNGMMANPEAGLLVSQGFDSSMPDGNAFDAADNVARPGDADLGPANTYVAPAGTSLVASISVSSGGQRPQLTDVSVFTVVAAAPAAGSFRPPYCGTDKTHHWNESDIDYDVVKDVLSASGAPNLTTTANRFTRAWIEIKTEFTGRAMHPINNQTEYGQYMAYDIADGLLLLHTALSNAQKRDLMVRMVQYGIDIYGSAVAGGNWRANGGHNVGRKGVLYLAGKVLGDTNILWYADKENFYNFSEDEQTFYVDQSTVDRTNNGTDKPLASLVVSGDYVIATTTGPHGISLSGGGEWVIRIAGATPSEYNGDWYMFKGASSSTTMALKKRSTENAPALSPASVVGTATYFGFAWNPDSRQYAIPYAEGDIGLEEWGMTHKTEPSNDNNNWYTSYRAIAGNCLVGHALFAHLIDGGTADWNWPAFFDYQDRLVGINGPLIPQTNGIDQWTYDMWNLYRNGVPTYPFITNAVINAAGTTLTLTFSQSCTTGSGGAGGFSITASGYTPTVTYFSGSGSTTYAYTLDPAIPKGLVAALNYVQPGNGIESTADGVDVNSFTGSEITNNSTQEAPAVNRSWRKPRLRPRTGL